MTMTMTMTRAEAERLIREAVAEIARRHPNLRLDTVNELLDVGELRVGLEILCDNLLEDALSLSSRSRDNISAAAAFLGMPPDYWQDLSVREP
jgi:hypothetical protein